MKHPVTLSVLLLSRLSARHIKVERARDRAIEREDYERADDWHSHAARLSDAVTYLETRVARTVRP